MFEKSGAKKFDIEEFKKVCIGKFEIPALEIANNCIYIYFSDPILKYLRISDKEFMKHSNCINIYHHNGRKNGFWWNGDICYKSLIEEIESSKVCNI
jgi:hypothetical protein